MKNLFSILFVLIGLVTSFNANAQTVLPASTVDYMFMVTVPAQANKPTRSFETIFKTINEAITDSSESQNVNCWRISISEFSVAGNDINLTGSFSCLQKSWSDLNLQQLTRDLKSQSGLNFTVLPPPGGGAVIHN